MRSLLTAMTISFLWIAGAQAFTFQSIDGGNIDIKDWKGQPVLVVNTASLCGFTYQFDGLQALYDTYRDEGLVVLAVPSDDFNQELASGEEVKEFCAINFDLDLPMTMITPVTGDEAHPFFQWVKDKTGFAPNWNFNKVLLDRDGEVVKTWRSATRPESRSIRRAIEAELTAPTG